MNYEAMPILRVEIERINSTIQSMLGTHGSELGELLCAGVEKAVEAYDIDGQVSICVNSAINKAVDDYFKYGEGRNSIEKLVKAAFSE